jgi:multidrug efflux pump subunit AcrA (membrane-fusion protein)
VALGCYIAFLLYPTEKNRKVTQKKKLIALAVAVVIAAGAAKYFWPSAAAEAKSPVQTVTTTRVKKQDFPVTLETTGNTLAVNVVDIRPQVTNVVAKIHVKEGQMVKKGDLLFSLDDRADRANYEKALATAEDAKRQLSRAQELVKQQFVSQSAADTAQSNAQAAQAAANAAQAVLSYDTIRSPIDGRIGIINVFPGALVQPGNTVSTTTTATATTAQGAMATVTQLDPINVQFTIPEAMLPVFFEAQKEGKPLTVEFQVGSKPRQGKIYVIDNQVDVAIGAVKAKAVVDNADQGLIPGQFVRLKAVAGDIKDALVVPSQAVVMSPRGEQIYVVNDDDTVALKPVKVKAQSQGLAVVTGLEEGARVVVEGKQNLRPNSKIREAQAKPPGAPGGAPAGGAPAGEGGAKGASADKPAEGAASANATPSGNPGAGNSPATAAPAASQK